MNDSDSDRRKGEILAFAERRFGKNVEYVKMGRKTKLDEQNNKKSARAMENKRDINKLNIFSNLFFRQREWKSQG